MSKKKISVKYSKDEIFEMEKFFCLQFGGDFVVEDGYYLFSKTEISKLYDKYLKDLIGIVKDGNEKDRKYALDLILGLSIQPMRLH